MLRDAVNSVKSVTPALSFVVHISLCSKDRLSRILPEGLILRDLPCHTTVYYLPVSGGWAGFTVSR